MQSNYLQGCCCNNALFMLAELHRASNCHLDNASVPCSAGTFLARLERFVNGLCLPYLLLQLNVGASSSS